MKDERPVNKLIRPVLLSMQIIILRGPSGTECFFKKWEPFAFGPSWTGTTMESPMRVIISACVTDIGGNPQRRHSTLGSAFCEEVLNREFRASLQPTGYDHVHIPADFDSTKPVKRWFIFDLDVRAELGADEVAQIPHQVYLASRQGDNW
ncbi:unnamed protein product [Aspergillus oryzae]|uniref:Unnamed protein product n=3 Tax=Aspergillus subgen. Circumdati TaxID=2720871 RepID=A0AAN5BWP3_ASPOZ|nr:unnamed protein product [Aspergillus oryzae]GMF89264.1 unnamed protein product [Aspergillus oryzae]GMG03035.1 unnamed protein product [Aspergillus oryzae]GMG28334.1 unnamed protein product [Aspergillus oryzae]GMG50898.1 unnamed protein product [Aspergillus oryzae var. brunneus]